MADRRTLETLRAPIRALEKPGTERAPVLPVGVPDIDEALPWGGLPLGRLHQVTGGEDGFLAPALAFVAGLAGRLANPRETGAERGPVLWVVQADTADDALYGPGLAAFGLPYEHLVVARATSEAEVLWCMEEGLRCSVLAAVVAQVRLSGRAADRTAGRRLQLAAEQGGTTGFLLPSAQGAGWRTVARPATATVATTRWRVEAAPAAPAVWHPGGLGAPRWFITLERCQGGLPRSWFVERNDATGRLALVAALPDGPIDPAGNAPGRLA